ncbi:Integrase-like, catalytic domain [Phytophthora cactorum]|nr:Integrase-like, catalytic domain [Phytophthora cactorum]KAF1780173.1 Integrase-like, catalytic domain [Phytophthora cactorum]KAF1780176.1 Integrase-like, catalytic domain [Phytophthora cactorum]KAF1786059.1 Integrase-like, catalytic domain [Phytophthora cactorum]
MARKNTSKTRSQSNLDEIKQLITRDIKIGSEHDNLEDTSITLYVRQALKLYNAGVKKYQWDPNEFINNVRYPNNFEDAPFQKTFNVPNSDIIALLMSIYTSKETLIMTLNALSKMVKNRYRETFGYYSTIRKELSKQNKAEKLDNELTPEEEEKYISYQELIAIPDKVKTMLTESYGKIFLSRSEYEALAKTKRTEYLKLVFDYVALWLNVHYPLRLVWPTILLSPVEGDTSANYLQGNNLHLNHFKNVKLMGPQTIQLDSTAVALIKSYLEFLTNTLGEHPQKLLWRLFNRQPGEYDYSNASNGFSKILSNLFLKYNGKPMSMNMIRHIFESHLIQSPSYAKLTNREKNDLHAKLLHSTMAANTSYNKIANRTTAPEVSFEPTHEPLTEPPASPLLRR